MLDRLSVFFDKNLLANKDLLYYNYQKNTKNMLHSIINKICFNTIIYYKVFGMHIIGYKNFGPGVLACATRGGGRSEAGHCFHLLSSTPSAFHPLWGISRA